jgi:hypothetical protein
MKGNLIFIQNPDKEEPSFLLYLKFLDVRSMYELQRMNNCIKNKHESLYEYTFVHFCGNRTYIYQSNHEGRHGQKILVINILKPLRFKAV